MHKHIKRDDRVCIALLLQKRYTYTRIGKELGFHRTTIQREIKRNSSMDGTYFVCTSNKKSLHRRKESKVSYRVIDTNQSLKNKILKYLKIEYSPEQISGSFNDVSHMTIYRYINRNSELKRYLRRKGKRRRKYGTVGIPSRYQRNKRNISTRPTLVGLGNWEGDTIVGKERKLRIITHLEVSTGYLVAHLSGATAEDVYQHTKKVISKLPCQTITYDNGSEFALHQMIERVTDTKVYFADPGKPHQRGANENVNGLLRQYFPKGSSFASITNTDVQRAVKRINSRPRKRFNYLSPKEMFKSAIDVLI